jgi:acyl phosphate:glycerol-3-phosphate acyltransferase
MPDYITLLLVATTAYLVGSVPFAVLVSRLFNLADPRSFGSGNPGATNVLRTGNKLAALLTLLGDAGKGGLAVLGASLLPIASPLVLAVAGLFAFIGHLFPVFLRFQGGKGVATALGVILAFEPWLGLAVAGVWVAVALITRYSSLAALLAAVAAPLLALWLLPETAFVVALLGMSALLFWRHAANIQRLFAGTEGRIGSQKRASV